MSTHKLSNKEVVVLLKEVLAAMEVKKYNFFKIRAYQNAIAILDNITSSIFDIWENEDIEDVPGIGEGIHESLSELFTTGKVEEWERIKKDLPDGMFGLIGLRSVGVIKAYKLAKQFKLNDRETAIDKLAKHAKKNEIQVLPGFGEKSESQILEAIEQSKVHKSEKERTLLVKAEEIVSRVVEHMKELDCVVDLEACGSFRRRNPTVGDLDIPVATTDIDKTMKHFLDFSEIGDVVTKGDKRSTVVLKNDMQVDLYPIDPKAYGSMVQYFTGSKQHNILLRTYALERGLSLSEYGIKDKKSGELKEFSSEKEFYEYLGLPYIPPELRHGGGEIELAKKDKLPKLVELSNIKGDLHVHTNDSQDGVSELDDVVEKCIELGYEYVGITDHVPSIQTHTHAGIEVIIERKREKIDRAMEKYGNKIKILLGYEVNILADAKMSWPDELLSMLDYAIGGVHSAFNQDKGQMTRRIIAAIENPHIHIIAHPTNRLINERPGISADWKKILESTKKNNKILEINSYPQRLDLTYDLVKEAVDKGIKLIVNTDAHDISQLNFMKYGIDVARMGWCESRDIVNTYNFEEFAKIIGIKK